MLEFIIEREWILNGGIKKGNIQEKEESRSLIIYTEFDIPSNALY